jgi:hypothetical protein
MFILTNIVNYYINTAIDFYFNFSIIYTSLNVLGV